MKKRTYLVILLLLISTISLGCIDNGKEEKTVNDTSTHKIDKKIENTTITNSGNITTKITVKGRHLLVNGNPFIVKSVGYSPVPIGEDPESYYRDYYSYKFKDIYNRDLPSIREMGANTIRLWAWKNDEDHTDFLNTAFNKGKDPIYVMASFWINPQSDFSSPEVRNKLKTDFRKMVSKNKDNPAILMWVIGNELNAEGEHKYDSLFSLIDEMAEQAHTEEGANYHPVTTSLVDRNIIDTMSKYEKNTTHLDVWSVQLYRGKDFGDFFKEYQNVSTKPLLVLEFGIDAYDDRKKVEYEDVQAEYASTLWKHLVDNSDVVSGGSIMSYSDGWFKGKIDRDGREGCPDKDAWIHSDCGYSIQSHPDKYANVEWWGVARIKLNESDGVDIVEPRKAYYTLKDLWTNSSE